MNHYLHEGKLYCNDCVKKLGLLDEAEGPFEDSRDDYPLHCDGCEVFLENSLTDYGIQYVEECIREGEDSGEPVEWVAQWEKFYVEQFHLFSPHREPGFSQALFYDWDTLERWLKYWHLWRQGSFIYPTTSRPPLGGVGWVYDRGPWGISLYILEDVVPQWKLTGGEK